MPKIAFIGAGSLGFTRKLVNDVLTFPLLADSEIALMDINRERLRFSKSACEKIVAAGKYPARVTATLDRREALDGADAVLVTILCGNTAVWQYDTLIPEKYGVDINVGDTRGPSGIFRALRTIPTMLDICRDMEELCPQAIMLNYTNPMAMLCHAMQRMSKANVTGLCHSVQGTHEMIARWLGVKHTNLDYVCAGINHMAWFLRLEHKGRDMYPKLRKLVASNRKIYNEEQVRNEMLLALDYYVTESSGHNSEYNWWFRKRQDLVRKYCTTGTGWNPGHHAFILKEYLRTDKTWKKQASDWLNEDIGKKYLKRGHEYAAYIINAWNGGDEYEFNGNVSNNGLVGNLPQGACVEVPVVTRKGKYSPVKVGDLPASVAMLTNLSAQTEMLAVEGCLTGDARMVYQAIAHDPLTAAKLSLREIKQMVADMFRRNRKYLPHFKNVDL